MRATYWGILWHYSNRLDGKRAYLAGSPGIPPAILFSTREAARQHIRERYGYIAKRPDLRAEPHGWRVPRPVRVKVTVRPA